MITAMRLYCTNTADAQLSNANDCVLTNGAPSTSPITTKCGNTSTGYGRLSSGGSSSGWGNAGTGYGGIQAPNGHGFTIPNATLNLWGSVFPAGTWSPRLRLNVSNGTITASLYMVAYVYNSATNTISTSAFQTFSLASQTVGTSSANFDLTPVSLGGLFLGANSQVYWEAWCNITANNTSNAAASVGLVIAQSSTVGSNNSCYLDTPGYTDIGSWYSLSTAQGYIY